MNKIAMITALPYKRDAGVPLLPHCILDHNMPCLAIKNLPFLTHGKH